MDPEADLMRRVGRGEEGAFRSLVERWQKPAYNFFFRLAGGVREDAEDLTQELFTAIYRAAPRYRPDAPFKAYFYRIASNLAASHLRKRTSRAALSIDAMLDDGIDVPSERHDDDPARALDARETRRRYEGALQGLPPEWRIALELRVSRELSYEEIARALGKSVAAVESMLFRARERIAREMSEGRGRGGRG